MKQRVFVTIVLVMLAISGTGSAYAGGLVNRLLTPDPNSPAAQMNERNRKAAADLRYSPDLMALGKAQFAARESMQKAGVLGLEETWKVFATALSYPVSDSVKAACKQGAADPRTHIDCTTGDGTYDARLDDKNEYSRKPQKYGYVYKVEGGVPVGITYDLGAEVVIHRNAIPYAYELRPDRQEDGYGLNNNSSFRKITTCTTSFEQSGNPESLVVDQAIVRVSCGDNWITAILGHTQEDTRITALAAPGIYKDGVLTISGVSRKIGKDDLLAALTAHYNSVQSADIHGVMLHQYLRGVLSYPNTQEAAFVVAIGYQRQNAVASAADAAKEEAERAEFERLQQKFQGAKPSKLQ
ncbi:hypothetical protein FO488_15995 [Geobacter sp. FeAm09]|uniref:hypothetical protein n=1 Tax=Geobacter sp. FeAm09 TaxID=2597769 RepID=UPI0011F0207E|nr:hypothetical protein [Geobacter sp. FeAm09]QEM69510.1 hypothetical protein FO488_15995 [Geobacter sp. FeAm09]